MLNTSITHVKLIPTPVLLIIISSINREPYNFGNCGYYIIHHSIEISSRNLEEDISKKFKKTFPHIRLQFPSSFSVIMMLPLDRKSVV